MQTGDGTLLGGRVHYAQPLAGYRTGIEPVLLAASITARAGDRVLEAGTGAGAGLLCLASRVPGLRGTGVERDPSMAELARRNMRANGAECDVLQADVTSLPALPGFQHVLANPPWHDPASTRSAEARRDAATHRDVDGPFLWIDALIPLLMPGGTLSLVLPAGLAGQAVACLHKANFGRLVLAPLWPRAGQAAKIVVIQARRGTGPSQVAPGLVLHRAGQGYTAEAESILRDGAAWRIL